MERRKFLGGLTAASLGALIGSSFPEALRAQSSTKTKPSVDGQSSFEPSYVEVSGNKIFLRRYGKGPAILMVHGFPRTSLFWRESLRNSPRVTA